MKKSDFIFLFFILPFICLNLFFLSSCRESGRISAVPYIQEPIPSSVPTPAPTPEPVLIAEAEYTEIQNRGRDLIPLCFSGGCFYCVSDEKTGEIIPEYAVSEARRKKREVINDGRYDVYSIGLYKVSPNGHVASLPDYAPVEPEINPNGWKDFCSITSVDALKRLPDGTFVAIEHTSVSGNSAPERKEDQILGKNYLEYQEKYYLRTLDKRGGDLLTREISSSEANDMLTDGSFPSGLSAENSGLHFSDFGVTECAVVSTVEQLKNGGFSFITYSFDSTNRVYSYELVNVNIHEQVIGDPCKVLYLSNYQLPDDVNKSIKPTKQLEKELAAFNREHMGTASIRFCSDPEDSDLLVLSVPDAKQLAEKGELVDLYGFMSRDNTVQKTSFLQNIFNAAEVDGGLYCTCSGFHIHTLIGAASVVGNRCSWNYDEFREAWWGLGQGADALPIYMTKADVLQACLEMDGNLMSDTDREQLERFSMNFQEDYLCYPGYPVPENASDLRVSSHRQMLLPADLRCFEDVIRLGYEFSEEIAYVGWPTLFGTGSTLTLTTLDNGMNLAISTSCSDPDTAWSFLRTFFAAGYQSEMSAAGRFFPTRYSCFNRGLADIMSGEIAVDKDGKTVYDSEGRGIFVSLGSMYLSDFSEVRYYPVSQQRADNFRMLAESVNKLSA